MSGLCGACCVTSSGEETIIVPVASSEDPPKDQSPPEDNTPAAPAVVEAQEEEPAVQAPLPAPVEKAAEPEASATAPVKTPSSFRDSEIFNVNVELNGQKLGLDINYHDGVTVLITKINEGPVATYNRGAQKDAMVAVGDRMTAVNGVTGEVKQILDAVKKEPTMRAEVRRAPEKKITLARPEGDKTEMGFQMQAYDLFALTVSDAPAPDSLLAKHNEADAEFDLKKDDYIMEVNGIRGDVTKMLEAFGSGDSWEISFRRIERRRPAAK